MCEWEKVGREIRTIDVVVKRRIEEFISGSWFIGRGILNGSYYLVRYEILGLGREYWGFLVGWKGRDRDLVNRYRWVVRELLEISE